MWIIVPGLLVAAVNALIIKSAWKHKIAWWEPLPPILMNLVICISAKFTAELAMTTDYEFHGGWGVVGCHQEPWTRWYEVEVDDYCDKTVTENGKRVTKREKCGSHKETRYDSHPEQFWLENSNGEVIETDSNDYRWLSQDRWRNQVREDGHHSDYDRVKFGFHDTGEGYLHKTRWPGDDDSLVPTTTLHKWTNKVQSADQSLFHFPDVDKEDIKEYGLFELPSIERFYRMRYISGMSGAWADMANRRLEFWNAKLGREKQVQMRLLVFKDKPFEASLSQEAYWQGGNKNEFTLCVGVDSKTLRSQWAHVISWSEAENLKVKVRDYARSMDIFDPVEVADYMGTQVRKDFVRKQFAEFNYLKVATPTWAYWVGFFLSVLVTAGFDVWAIRNEFGDK